ncbi:MAG: 2-oxoglutarate dehydrogenase E1 component [Chloroflexi bacterium]|nr:2-oxoglutarate dehydrogenase E1 component [Chloroflexota bacterium]
MYNSHMSIWHDFHGPNAGYVLELYERYRQNPNAVDEATRRYFQQWTPPLDGAGAIPSPAIEKIVGAANLVQAIREYGHLAAQLDPLGSPPPGDPSLEPASHGITAEDLRQLPASLIGGPAAEGKASAWEAVEALRAIYSSTTGYDYDHLRDPAEREWLRHVAESRRFRPPGDPCDPKELLKRLTQVETFELFLHRIFPGKTRFSIEGLDIMVPMLDEIIGGGAEAGIYTILLGMAHRGRLNVLAHILNMPYELILTQFKDPAQSDRYDARNYMGWSGDVKYHAGALRAIDLDDDPIDLVIKLAPNPSHLEHVNPVVAGMARAAGTYVDRPGHPEFNHAITLPILIHGDASFPAQGIVAETLNMYRLRGYRVGGTIHLIANNQIGFTTATWAGRSTLYASDLAKGFKIPVVHVNADDPEACIEAARLAIAYRQRFLKDFVIDLIGYRRYGHNEGDEPRFTQPRMYQAIDSQPTVRQQWAERLVEQGIVEPGWPEELVLQTMGELQQVYESLQVEKIAEKLEPQLEPPPEGAARRVKTAVPAETLRELNLALLELPGSFQPNPKLERAMKRRRTALDELDEPAVDWATAEELALATILAEGTAIRFTGEDAERGTFGQRHALFHDVETGKVHVPLQIMPQARAAFEIRNSPLSENAAIGFEYGYNIQAPERLVIWEAQYGDFINAAQAIIDEFIVSGKAKWEQTPSLVLLLPHGYEGQGPDHSTGRLERFLQMAANTNMRIAVPTTAGQYFHLLRRQAALLKTDPLPLIVMTPKSLLRHPLAASPPRELAEGQWRPVIGDPQATERPEEIRRLIFCSGKVSVDLVSLDEAQRDPRVAIARVEQLYAFPRAEIEAVLDYYPKLEEVVWLQEEPANMGAWPYMRSYLEDVIQNRWPLRTIGRPDRASPAEGSFSWHQRNQRAIVEEAFRFES